MRFQTCGDPELVKMVAACQEWHSAFVNQEEPRWLSFIGESGTGKTHCVKRLWEACHRRLDFSKCGYIPQIIYWPEFVQRLKSGNGYEMRNDLKRWPLLVLDDVGTERDPNGFAADELNTLCGVRMDKWTLLTSNLDMAGFEKIDQRIASRLYRGKNICLGVKTKDFYSR